MDVSLLLSDYLVLIVYVAILLIVGFWVLGKNKSSERDIFLGGRSLRWWHIGISLFSANAGPMMLVGMAGIGFTNGVVGSNFEWLAWIFLLLLGMFFLPHYLVTKISTMPQFLLARFGKPSYNFLVVYSLISILIVWLGSALYAGGLIISQVFNWSLIQSIVLVALLSASFTAIGGLKAVVRTSIFQSSIIIVSSIVITVLALRKIGGVKAMIDAVPAHYLKLFRPASDPEYSWIAVILGYPVVAIYYWCADQTIVQKVLAARDIRQGQWGTMFISVLKIFMPFIFIFPGMMCFVLYKDIARPDNAYITLVQQLMPHGLLGLCMAALIAALIDTVSSGLNSFSTIFTLDVYDRAAKLTEKERRSAGRWFTMLAAGLAILIAWMFSRSGKGFFDLSQGLVSILAPPLSVVFLAGITSKRVSSRGAEIVLYGGGLACIIIGICYILNFPSKHFWPHFLLLSFYIFLVLAIVIILVTIFWPNSEKTSLPTLVEANKQMRTLSKPVWKGWGIVAIIMILIYYIFA